jgi:hypothetical protein
MSAWTTRAAMIEAGQTKFPQLDFMAADAVDLSAFQDESFDEVVFSFNGIARVRATGLLTTHLRSSEAGPRAEPFFSQRARGLPPSAAFPRSLLQRSYGVCFDLGMIFTE